MSQHAMSIAEGASEKTPPGPELDGARRGLAPTASTWVGSSPTTSRASASTAALSAGVSAPPKKVRPRPTRPWSVPSSSVTNSRVSVGAGRPTTSGLSAGVRSTRVVTWVIFISLSFEAQKPSGERSIPRGRLAPPDSRNLWVPRMARTRHLSLAKKTVFAALMLLMLGAAIELLGYAGGVAVVGRQFSLPRLQRQ